MANESFNCPNVRKNSNRRNILYSHCGKMNIFLCTYILQHKCQRNISMCYLCRWLCLLCCSYITYRSARHLDNKHTVFGRWEINTISCFFIKLNKLLSQLSLRWQGKFYMTYTFSDTVGWGQKGHLACKLFFFFICSQRFCFEGLWGPP